MGKTDVENAFERLDTLTKEDNLMAAARTFEVTHDVNVNMKAAQELTHHVDKVLQQVDGNTRVTQELELRTHVLIYCKYKQTSFLFQRNALRIYRSVGVAPLPASRMRSASCEWHV